MVTDAHDRDPDPPVAASGPPGNPEIPSPDAAPRLVDLTWEAAAAWFRRDPRLIVPVGSCMQHGPHLPLNADTIIIEAITGAIAARWGVLLAPTIPFGAASDREREYAGTAALRPKSLHRILNELVSEWESHGVREFILMTANGYGPHVSALVGILAEHARIRAVDMNAVDLSRFLDAPPEHAGEFETSLLLHLSPERVIRDRIEDAIVEETELAGLLNGSEPMPPAGSPGVVGRPTAATAEKGRDIYEYLVEHIGSRLFARGEGGEDGKGGASAPPARPRRAGDAD